MSATRAGLLRWALAGGALGVAYPLVDLWLACRVPRIPRTEACMWGEAYLPLSLTLGAVMGLVAGVMAGILRRAVRGRDR